MALNPGPIWYFTAGLMAGGNMAYLLTVLLGVLLPSWSFNGLFTPLAGLSVALQVPYMRCLVAENRSSWRRGAWLGATVLGATWFFYCYGAAL